MLIPEIIKIIEKNKKLLNPYYSNIELTIMYDRKDDEEHYSLRIPTNCKAPPPSRLEKIKKLFKGVTNIMFVEDKPNFWCIQFYLLGVTE